MESNEPVVKKNKKYLVIPIVAVSVFLVLNIVLNAGALIFTGVSKIYVKNQLSLGDKYITNTEYDKAVLAYSKVIKIDPNVTEAYYGLADAYGGRAQELMDSGDYVASVDVIGEGIRMLNTGFLTTGDSQVEQYRSNLYSKQSEYKTRLREAYSGKAEDYIGGLEEELYSMVKRLTKKPEKYNFSDDEVINDSFPVIASCLNEPVFYFEGKYYVGVYPNGYVYYGEMLNGKREGKGFWCSINQESFYLVESGWKDDLPEGKCSIKGYENAEYKAKGPGSAFLLCDSTDVPVKQGIFSGKAFVSELLYDGRMHSWEIQYKDGYPEEITPGIVSYCNTCGATIYEGQYLHQVEGIELSSVKSNVPDLTPYNQPDLDVILSGKVRPER